MKNTKNVFLALGIALLGMFQLQAWPDKLIVMQHPKTKHIVGFMGDVHIDDIAKYIGIEKACIGEIHTMRALEKSFTNFMNKSDAKQQAFAVEVGSELPNNEEKFKVQLKKYGLAGISLIERCRVLGDKNMSPTIKKMASQLDSCFLNPKLPIEIVDIRPTYAELWKELALASASNSLENFEKRAAAYKGSFMKDIIAALNSVDTKSCFYAYMLDKGTALLADLFMSKDPNNYLNWSDFFVFTLADFYYLSYIAQSQKNIMLYLGYVHCDNLQKDLENIGYKTIFAKGETGEIVTKTGQVNFTTSDPFTEKDFEEFFALAQSGLKK